MALVVAALTVVLSIADGLHGSSYLGGIIAARICVIDIGYGHIGALSRPCGLRSIVICN